MVLMREREREAKRSEDEAQPTQYVGWTDAKAQLTGEIGPGFGGELVVGSAFDLFFPLKTTKSPRERLVTFVGGDVSLRTMRNANSLSVRYK